MRTHCIAEWMSTPPIVVPPTMMLAAAQHMMEERHVRRLPVVQDGRLVGIVTWAECILDTRRLLITRLHESIANSSARRQADRA
jgi:signal-transduction protein with cAMP-binding, CBS, and nucleotidyltransferase domain